jgi:hypothetical protein
MARYEHLPIYKKAFDLAVYVDNMVRGFSRYHKYTHGTDLRNGTRQVLRLIIRANNTFDKEPHLLEMREVLEDFMVSLRLCKELKVFPNFNSFVYCLNEAVGISRQNEGWRGSLKGGTSNGFGPNSPS